MILYWSEPDLGIIYNTVLIALSCLAHSAVTGFFVMIKMFYPLEKFNEIQV